MREYKPVRTVAELKALDMVEYEQGFDLGSDYTCQLSANLVSRSYFTGWLMANWGLGCVDSADCEALAADMAVNIQRSYEMH